MREEGKSRRREGGEREEREGGERDRERKEIKIVNSPVVISSGTCTIYNVHVHVHVCTLYCILHTL